jgi:acetylornithine deacetylase
MLKIQNIKSGLFMGTDTLPLNSTLFSEAVAMLQTMIATPSYSGQESAVAHHVQNYLSSYAVKVNRQGNNLWCYNKYYESSKPTILLNSHLDTVKPNEGYTKDSFLPEITDGRLYGLGSNDAGGCLVSLMATFLHFYNRKNLAFNLCFAATAEEENSGNNGIVSILPLLGYLHLAIVGEPTLTQMAVAEKGNLVIDCVCTGRPGHAAREEGDNAIYKCLQDIQWFKTYQFTKTAQSFNPVKMTVTTIKAGLQHNIVPGKCEFTVDIRNDSSYTHQMILDVIKQHIRSVFTLRPGALNASSIDVDHPLVKAGIHIGCKTYSSPTTSDQAWLNIPSVKMGPGDSARSHSADEFIFIEEIKNGINQYIKLLDALPLMLINNFTKAPHHEINHINN